MATVSYKCPNCGGGLQFNPSTQKYKCEFCLSQFTQEQLEAMKPDEASDQKSYEDDSQAEMGGETGQQENGEAAGQGAGAAAGEAAGQGAGGGKPQQAAMLYTCPSCGAQIVTDETTAATFCYYCHNPVVLSGRLEGDFKPDYVVPFKYDKKQATQMFLDWIGKKKYVPKAFFSKQQIEKISGVYFPYLLFNCQIDGKIDAEATKLRVWQSAGIEYTETSRYHVQRDGNMQVEHVTRNALREANRDLCEGVLPFDMKEMKPFSMGYLSGFQAEKRDMEEADFQQEVETEVKDFAVQSLKNSVADYGHITITQDATKLVNQSWNYALMPVWTLTYKDKAKDKIYYFAMNGASGKICGKLPVDFGRLGILFASIFVPMLIILLIVGYMI